MKSVPQTNARVSNNETNPFKGKKVLLRNIFHNAATGLGFGSFFFLLTTAIVPGWIPVNTFSILTMFVLSALIGELTFLVSDGYLWGYIVHCVLTFTLTIGWILVNGWTFKQIPGGLASVVAAFVCVYAAIWIIIIANEKITVSKINKKVNERR
ncbi:DUF3021 family protein [Bifidobacterium sp. ESL0732]|uniref:DUF3021 family protein n=1 Tax=Bifidobacterium sp. ESL0732 TaxID=2983222 RepID=UPI0023F6D464|nr:DUF3021 family protein [Bifidobacterium sp. ESL0732]WEV63869.1 DUF3021 family protein [Bifidobacterium sp. ESL0732]